MEWTELKIDSLPSDILTGDYEFEFSEDCPWREETGTPIELLEQLLIENRIEYRYRKPEPLPPTHEEIMTKWFYDSMLNGGQWIKVIGYLPATKEYLIMGDIVKAGWFAGMELADIPPEGEF